MRDRSEPLIWVLAGPKAGDNAQLRALAAGIGAAREVRIVEKRLAFRRHELLLHLLPRPTLSGLDRSSRAGIVPPWPDLVLTAGRRNELVARWIRARAGSGTCLVHLGRPWSRPERFDLVVATPQYSIPPGRNVMTIPLPLHGAVRDRLQDAAAHWKARLAHLPRPWVAFLVGGDSGPFVFDAALAEHMADQINGFVASVNGSLLLTTSSRTPVPFTEALLRSLNVPTYSYQWRPEGGENPYWGFLALADRIAVTAESVSMITEALATGTPTYLVSVRAPGARPWVLRASSYRWKPLTHRLAMALAPRRFRRDVGRIHAALIRDGRAAWLGQGDPRASCSAEDGTQRAVGAALKLLD